MIQCSYIKVTGGALIEINSISYATVPGGTTLDIIVENSAGTPVGVIAGDYIIGDNVISINGAVVLYAPAETAFDIDVFDTLGNPIGAINMSDEFIISDTVDTLNGVTITGATAEGGKTIVVQTDEGVPVQVGTTLTDTATSLIIEVPAGGATSTISYSRENWRSLPVAYFTYDLAWYRANTTLFEYQDSGERVVLDKTDEDLLLTLNAFGNYLRTTNDLGGSVYDGTDGSTTNYLIDHLTGMGWYLLETSPGNTSWTDSAINLQTFTDGTYSDYRMPTAYDVRQIMYTDGTTSILTGHELYAKAIFWVMDSYSGTQASIWRQANPYGTTPASFNLPANISISAIACRNHYNANPSAPPVRQCLNTASAVNNNFVTSYDGNDQAQSPGDSRAFFVLEHMNGFGNRDRFTDTLGTQIYADDIVIDWLQWHQIKNQVLGFYRVPTTGVSQFTILNASPYTFGAYADWESPTLGEHQAIANGDLYNDNFNYAPFNLAYLSVADRLWSRATGDSGIGYLFYNTNFGQAANYSTVCRTIFSRLFSLNELGITYTPLTVIGYNRPFNGQTISFTTGDEGWDNINNTDPYIPPTNATMAVQDPDDWFKLLTLNEFGSLHRFTSKTGGYYDFSDSTWRTSAGVLTTFYDEFEDGDAIVFAGYIIDHYTGLAFEGVALGAAKFVDFISTYIPGYNSIGTNAHHGFTDWKIPSLSESMSIRHSSVSGVRVSQAYGFDLSPFFNIHKNVMTTTNYTPATTNQYRINVGGIIVSTFSPTTSTTYDGTLMRYHYTN